MQTLQIYLLDLIIKENKWNIKNGVDKIIWGGF